MTRALTAGLLALAAAVLVAAPMAAQAAPRPGAPAGTRPPTQARATPAVDSVHLPTVRALRAALADAAGADRELLPSDASSTLRAADDAVLDRRARARARIASGLDSLLDAGPAGRAAIQVLAAEWRGSDQVRRAEVRAAERATDAPEVLHLAEELLRESPRDTQVVRWRAQALGALGREADAVRAWQARFELAPEDESAWRDALRAHAAAGTLERLRQAVGRLRLIHPESRAVREREIEILHRLGRNDEAAKVAADTLPRPA